jgi:ubiquinone/menaquinone biosynthesis C-methylase UbiE
MQKQLSTKELNDIVQWDVKNWAKCLDFWNENTDLSSKKKVLAIGEREGGMSLYFALHGHEVICSDYNDMPNTTKKMHESYGVADLITYQKIDAKAIELETASVDVVLFKSVIGALGNANDQKQAFDEIYRVLKPNGILLFAENLEGSRLHTFLRKKFVKWGERWRYITESEMVSWNSKYTAHSTKSHGVIALFGRSEKQRRFLAHIDTVLSPITPRKWRYILFGVFKK